MNQVAIVGRISNDPLLNTTSSGIAYVRFSVAVSRPNFGNQSDQNTSDFINMVAWRNQAEFIGKYLRKGALVSVAGELRSSRYTNKNGETVFSMEVQVDKLNALETKQQVEAREAARAGSGINPLQFGNAPRNNYDYQNNNRNQPPTTFKNDDQGFIDMDFDSEIED